MFLTKYFSITKIVSVLIVFLSINSCAFLKKEIDLAAQKQPPFSVNQRTSPRVQAGQIEAQFNNLFPMPGIKTVKIDVLYFPVEDAVCLEYKLNTYTYQQFWHRAGRRAFVRALESYNDDFDGQKLRNRNTRTKSQYGVAEECYLVWQQSNISAQGYGNANIELGYYFRESSPFFAATQMESYFDSPISDPEFDQTSAEIPMFFTRAQAEELVTLFGQDYLQSIAPDARPPEARRSIFSR
jgi:hypothetical protein